MHRRFTGDRLVVATHNHGKLREILDLLSPFGVQLTAAGDLGLPEPDETGATFIANAELKALAATQGSGLPALADDSGPLGRCARRGARHLFGTLGRAGQGFRRRHGAGPARDRSPRLR